VGIASFDGTGDSIDALGIALLAVASTHRGRTQI
jgi:hypothetical protein